MLRGAGNGIRIPEPGSPSHAIAENPEKTRLGAPPSAAIAAVTDQSRTNAEPITDVVEQALADAIAKASAAGAWSAVEALTVELRARREARAGVVDLGSARKRRIGGAS